MTQSIKYPEADSPITIVKGGEKTEEKTKWEELGSLSKDELIIRLVKAETRYDLYVETIISIAKDGDKWCAPDLGERPTAEWLEKIATYAKAHVNEGDKFSYMDLVDYGVDYETAHDLWENEED